MLIVCAAVIVLLQPRQWRGEAIQQHTRELRMLDSTGYRSDMGNREVPQYMPSPARSLPFIYKPEAPDISIIRGLELVVIRHAGVLRR